MAKEDVQELARSGQWDTLGRILNECIAQNSAQGHEVLALLLIAAERGELKENREELLHRTMQRAICHDDLKLGKHLLDDQGVDVNAHGGLYLRLVLAKRDRKTLHHNDYGISMGDRKSLALEFFSRDLSRDSLERFPWTTLFSCAVHWMFSYEDLALAIAAKIPYDEHAGEIETALEFRGWHLLTAVETDLLYWRQEDYGLELDMVLQDNLKLRDFCIFWRVWDRLGAPKDMLAKAWRKKVGRWFSNSPWETEAEIASYISRFLSDPEKTCDG